MEYPVCGTTMSVASLHGIRRVRERCGVKNNAAAEMNIMRAIARGKCAEDFSSWEHTYLKSEAHDGCIAIAYNGFCYIVNSKGICVTVHTLPQWFGKKRAFRGKERIRDRKRYLRYNDNQQEKEEDAYEVHA